MQNDDKRASRDDETLPGDAEAEAAFDSEHDADISEEAEQSALRTPSPMPFPKTSRSGRTELEPNFGMPDFDFPGEKISDEDDSEEAGHAMMAAKETLDLPLGEGTGWDSVTSIERPGSLQGRLKRDPVPPRSDADASYAAPRGEANVMPFPGAGFPRSGEPTPVDMLRNSAADDEALEDFAATPDDAAEPVPDYDAVAQDTLADAVQSALRNVYGGQVADRSEESAEQGGYTVADTLMSSSTGRERSDPLWPEESRDWQKDAGEDYLDSERETATAEANTEAVLDYLYGQRRSGNRQEPSLSGESSLRDLSEAAGIHRDWQDDTPDFDDRPVSQPSLRDLAGSAYRGSSPRYVEQGDRAFLRDQELGYRGGPPAGEEPDWGQPTYLSHPTAHIAGGSAYPSHLPSTVPESLTSGAPDSGHLLGAAGLGLIGGIALAGVLAVFVFNSFVDENDPALADATPKVVERLASPPAAESAPEPAPRIETPPVRIETPAPVRSAVQTPPAVREERAEPVAPPAPRVVQQPEIPGQKLYAQNVIGTADNPVKLDIKVAEASDREDSLISLKGLPPEAKLSTGIDVGGGQWLLPPSRLKDLTVTLPKGTNAQFDLEVQLLKDDAQTTLSDPISFDLTIGNVSRGGAAEAPSSTAAAPESNAPLAVLPDETPQIETDFLTQMLIRDGNRLMRDGDIASARRLYEQAAANGNPEAALAMGRSFDPSYFEKLPVKTGKPDPATAFEWYKKALEGGLVTARVKIDALKQWLQR